MAVHMPYADPERRRLYDRERQKRRFLENRVLINELKSVPCADCGHAFDPVCMDFHHVGEKDAVISDLLNSGKSKTRILREAAKCVVLCACCHRLRHKPDK
jgi:hypothetical protein